MIFCTFSEWNTSCCVLNKKGFPFIVYKTKFINHRHKLFCLLLQPFKQSNIFDHLKHILGFFFGPFHGNFWLLHKHNERMNQGQTLISLLLLSAVRSVPPCTTRRAPASSRTWWPKQRRTASRSRCPSTSSQLTSSTRKPPPARQPSPPASPPAGWWEKMIYFNDGNDFLFPPFLFWW